MVAWEHRLKSVHSCATRNGKMSLRFYTKMEAHARGSSLKFRGRFAATGRDRQGYGERRAPAGTRAGAFRKRNEAERSVPQATGGSGDARRDSDQARGRSGPGNV